MFGAKQKPVQRQKISSEVSVDGDYWRRTRVFDNPKSWRCGKDCPGLVQYKMDRFLGIQEFPICICHLVKIKFYLS